MHKVVDCYIKGFDKADNGCVNIRLQPMFQKDVPGWLQRELKEEYVWHFDPNREHIFDLIRLYVEYACVTRNNIPNSKCHEQFGFDEHGTVLGIA